MVKLIHYSTPPSFLYAHIRTHTHTHTPECAADEDGLAATLEAIASLPSPNKDTLAFLILHLQRVAAQHEANKMPIVSLAKVFGPTIVGKLLYFQHVSMYFNLIVAFSI